MTCVTVERTLSPAISVLRSTPLVQKVSKVMGETLDEGTWFDHHLNVVWFIFRMLKISHIKINKSESSQIIMLSEGYFLFIFLNKMDNVDDLIEGWMF